MADLGYYVCTVIKTVGIFSLSTLYICMLNTIHEDVLGQKYKPWRWTGTEIQSMKMHWYKNTIYEDVLVLKYNLWRFTDTKIQSMMYWYKNTIYEDVLVLKYNLWRWTGTKIQSMKMYWY